MDSLVKRRPPLLRLPRDLVHLKVPGRGRQFRALLGCWMPDWQERQQRLIQWDLTIGSTDEQETTRRR